VRSKTPPEGYSVFLSYESSMCKTAIEHPRVAFSNASIAVRIRMLIMRKEGKRFERESGTPGAE